MIQTHPIQEVDTLAPYEAILRKIGYETLEEVVHIAQVASPELADYLKVSSVDDLLAVASASASTIPAEAEQTMRKANYSLGVAINEVPHLGIVPSIVGVESPPPSVNHISNLPPIRHQKDRGTCVAHAALAVYEHLLWQNGTEIDFSEQFLYWNCKRNDDIPKQSGTYLGIAFPLLKQDGCCLENTWSYQPNPIPGNEGQGPPPGGSLMEALHYRIGDYNELAPNSVPDIKAELSQGRCVAFSIPVFNSWYGNQFVMLTGDIGNPLPKEVRRGGHAMCLVGYIDHPDKAAWGGGRFILRNSWGDEWGIESPYGPGYGTIPYSYISRFCVEAFSIK